MAEMFTPTRTFTVEVDGVAEVFTAGTSRVAAGHPLLRGAPGGLWRPVTAADGGPTRSTVREATADPTQRDDMSLEEELRIRTAWVEQVEARARRDETAHDPDPEAAFWREVDQLLDVTSPEERATQALYDKGIDDMNAATSRRLEDERDEIARDYGWKL